eukprot:m.41769 g.41769  ORF g.41769 m.41769 type:complete len:598 (+) comp14980_c0_seq1:545-2338(+)
MDPAHMQQAAAAMAAMSPEQRAQMGQMFSNMDPSMFANMAKSLGMPQVSEDQIKEAQQKLSSGEINMDDASHAAQAMPQQALYMTNGAKALKEQGNTLFRQQKYAEAAELYIKAMSNLNSVVPSGAVAIEHAVVLKACRLNTARCHLETNQYTSAEDLCTAVLADSPRDLKALFRRGLAREKLKKIAGSVQDLTLAVEDPRADSAVKDALARVQNLLPAQAPAGADTTSPAMTCEDSDSKADAAKAPVSCDSTSSTSDSSHAKADTSTDDSTSASYGGSTIASKDDIATASKDSSGSPGADSTQPSSDSAGSTPAGLSASARAQLEASQRQMRERLARDPSMLDHAQAQIANMDPSTLQSMLKMQGFDIPDEQVKSMQAASAAMPKDAFRDQMQRSVNTPLPDTLPGSGAAVTSTAGAASNSAAAPPSAFPGMPNGQMPDANQMKMAADMMKNMKPEQMEKMMKMASAMGPMMGQTAGAGGMPKPEDMAKLTDELKNNPEMMKNMTDMVKDLDPQVLASMSKQAGMSISPEQAEQMTSQMKNLTPDQMAKLMTWTTRLQNVLAWLKWLWNILFGSQLKAAGTILFLALLLANWLGYV